MNSDFLSARRDDERLLAPGDARVAVGVNRAEVACVEPAVLNRLGRVRGPAIVARHDVRAARQNLAVVGDAQFDVREAPCRPFRASHAQEAASGTAPGPSPSDRSPRESARRRRRRAVRCPPAGAPRRRRRTVRPPSRPRISLKTKRSATRDSSCSHTDGAPPSDSTAPRRRATLSAQSKSWRRGAGSSRPAASTRACVFSKNERQRPS